MKMKGPTDVKGPTRVNFKHGGGQKIFARSARELSHFENDGGQYCGMQYTSISSDPVSNSMLLELKRGGTGWKGVGKG